LCPPRDIVVVRAGLGKVGHNARSGLKLQGTFS
jgi:hypothetical protein